MGKAIAALVVLIAGQAHAQWSWFNGFEPGNSNWTASRGAVSIVSDGCLSGSYCSAHDPGTGPFQSVLWEKLLQTQSTDLYFSGWWRFPVGYTWDEVSAHNGLEHKLAIFNTPTQANGRILLNLRGRGRQPALALYTELSGGGINKRSDVRWPMDGRWHRLEVLAQRQSGSGSRVQVFLDGAVVIDETGRMCGDPCERISSMQVGAYRNQDAPRVQRYWTDDFFASDMVPGEPAPELTLEERVEELERRVDALEEDR